MYVWPSIELTIDELTALRPTHPADHRRAPGWRRSRSSAGSATADRRAEPRSRCASTLDSGPACADRSTQPPTEPLEPLDDYRQKVLRARRRGTVYPYELTGCSPGRTAASSSTTSTTAASWSRSTGRRGSNKAAIVAGVVSTPTERHPEGVTRVVLLGDPTKALGALSEPECARVIAALDLAERMRVPLEWFALSAGARISMDSGTENMDWVAAALKRIVDVHPGRRRDQHRGRRHQRRRPAVLERRGDDAHAHQGHPGDDAGLGDGADRQAVARLLRRRVGRGQLRHRRLRPGDGPQRPGAVLGAGPAGAPATC